VKNVDRLSHPPSSSWWDTTISITLRKKGRGISGLKEGICTDLVVQKGKAESHLE